jgi:cell division septation protein DedD
MDMAGTIKARLGLSAVLVMAVATGPLAEIKPAELPPAGYAGLQYVDTLGCAFMRAGTDADPVWVPRVTAGGAPLCDNPPSGNRVPVAGEAGSDNSISDAGAAPDTAPEPASSTQPAGSDGFVVAVGSFGVARNVDKAVAKLTALGYPASRGRLEGGSAAMITVFAGPFASAADAEAALSALRAAGFPDAVMLSL